MLKHLRHSLLSATLLCITLLTSACASDLMKELGELAPLRDQLVQTYAEDEINLQIQNGHAINVSFINSSFNDLPQADKEPKAQEIAQFVKDHYASIGKIDRISVSFVVHKQYVIFNYTNGLDTFFFDTKELKATPPAP